MTRHVPKLFANCVDGDGDIIIWFDKMVWGESLERSIYIENPQKVR